jgi:hypothetical protein
MLRRIPHLVAPLALFVAGVASAEAASPKRPRDTTAPTVSIAVPTAGASVRSSVAVSGSAGDNVQVAKVEVKVDGGAYVTAAGTTGWSLPLDTTKYANGTHTISARATDSSGNVSTVAAVSVSFNNTVADTAAPSVAIVAPAAGATVSGSVTVSGTASDNVAVGRVEVKVDSGAWSAASGTTAWTSVMATSTLANGTHVLWARATDSAGNATTTSATVTVQNVVQDTTAPSVAIASPSAGATVTGTVTVSGTAADNAAVSAVDVQIDGGPWQRASGTSTWSYAWSTGSLANGTHTVAARATDTSGNTRLASVSVSVSDATAAPPATQGTWVSPEGVTINVSSAGAWTIAQIYSILKANALDLDRIGPRLTINVQDQYASQTQSSAVFYMGTYNNYEATISLQGVNSGFAERPDDILTHEYGHAWSMYWFYLGHQGDWSSYKAARWTTSDGSMTLASDSRTGSSYTWQVGEIVADDYRLLLGSAAAVSERPTHLNNQIPDPRNVPGLRDFLLNSWRAP